jgi:V/A-type H+/Na+-transporting ATPase subunit G/H
MALEVLTEIKAAEEAAIETRRIAAAAAKDSIKLAEQENTAYREQMIAQAKAGAAKAVAQAQQASKKKLEAQQAKRFAVADALRENAAVKLQSAAKVCIERILK